MNGSDDDWRDDRAEARDDDADQRDQVDADRDRAATQRDVTAAGRDNLSFDREAVAREQLWDEEIRALARAAVAHSHEVLADSRARFEQAVIDREAALSEIDMLRGDLTEVLDAMRADRQAAARDRLASLRDREHAATHRVYAAEDRAASSLDRAASAGERSQREIDRNLAPDDED